MPLPRLQSGQPASKALSARVLNEAFRGIERKQAEASISVPASPVIVIVQNTGTDPINIYHPCGIGDSLNEHPDGMEVSVLPLLFEAVEPATDNLWGIAQAAIKPNETGPVMLIGLTWAYLGERASGDNFGAPSTGYDPLDGAASGRFQILSSATTGTTRLFAGVLTPLLTGCAEYFILRVEGGPTAGTIPWSVIDLVDDSTASSGTYTLGDSYTTIKSVIDTDLSTDCLILGGPLPGNGIVIHLNRGLSASRWRFKIGTASLTPQAGFGCYAVVDACCVAGG